MRTAAAVAGLVDGIAIAPVPEWYTDSEGELGIPITVSTEVPPGSLFPRRSRWYLRIRAPYPTGSFDIYPAALGGIVETYPHQQRNAPNDNRPWRTGNICLEEWIAPTLKERRLTIAPLDAIIARCERLVVWCQRAATGQLTKPGDPFEFPSWNTDPSTHLYYHSRALTKRALSFGKPRLIRFERRTTSSGSIITVGRAHGTLGTERVKWTNPLDDHLHGAWMRTKTIPSVPPHAPIDTGIQLEQWLNANGTSLRGALRILPEDAWAQPQIPLAFAASTPSHWDGPRIRETWHVVWLPNTSSGDAPRQRVDRFAAEMHKQKALKWMSTYDMAHSQHHARGCIESLADQHVGIIGLGALGSHVAEQLVRSGVGSMVLIDGEDFEPGNTNRHVLTMDDVHSNKATGMRKRLCSINPDASIVDIPHPFGSRSATEMTAKHTKAFDWILDCTGEDGVIPDLEGLAARDDCRVMIASCSPGLRRLVVHQSKKAEFNVENFHESTADQFPVDPTIEAKIVAGPGAIGCQNPLMPGLNLQVAHFACHVVQLMDRIQGDQEVESTLTYDCGSGPT